MEKQQLDWKEVKHSRDIVKKVTIEKDGFTCILEIVYDTDHDWTDSRGQFTDQESDDAIPNPRAEYERNVCKFFIPETSEEEHYRELLELKYSEDEARRLAKSYVNQDLLIAADPQSQGYSVYGVRARVLLKNVELADASCWGFETDKYHDDPELEVNALEELDEALIAAKKKLQELREA